MIRPPRLAARNSAWLLLSHWRVLWRVAGTDLRARYAGSLLGAAWAFVAPLLLLAVYAVVYLFIFRIGIPGFTSTQYVLYIFAGLVPYLATAEALSLGVGSVVTNRAVLNNTVFPIDLAPAKAVLTTQGTVVSGIAVVLVGGAVSGTLSWTVLALPVLLLLHALGLLGVVWLLSLLNVVFRDLQSLLSILLLVLLVGSPIAYTPEMVPGALRPLVLLNPLAYLLGAYQSILVLGQLPPALDAAVLVALCLGSFWLGGRVFARGKRLMADYV